MARVVNTALGKRWASNQSGVGRALSRSGSPVTAEATSTLTEACDAARFFASKAILALQAWKVPSKAWPPKLARKPSVQPGATVQLWAGAAQAGAARASARYAGISPAAIRTGLIRALHGP